MGTTKPITYVLFRATHGFTNTSKVLSEIDKPRKTLVKGIVIATITVCIMYMLVNLSYVRRYCTLNVHDEYTNGAR